MIYLDSAATTRVDSEVINAMNEAHAEGFYNPSALYLSAVSVKEKIETARGIIADKLSVKQDEIYFTSGATEANNWAIFNGYRNRKGNIITTQGEHASVYECFSVLKNKGIETRFAPLNSDGTVNAEKIIQLIDVNTLLVSVIHRSNETGAVNDIFKLCGTAKSINQSLLFHSDGVQAFCKMTYPNGLGNIDLYSVSGHKINAAKGVGALYIKKSASIRPYIFGGGQENGQRSGTENVAGILGFGKAAELYSKNYCPEKIRILNEQIVISLSNLGDVKINSFNEYSNIISASIGGINAEVLQRLLAAEGIYIGLGSACASRLKTNRVLAAMGIESRYQAGSIRLSLGTDTTGDDVCFALKKIEEKVKTLRSNSIG